MLELVALHYSPWSEKARWSLDHHKLQYRLIGHLPMLGAPVLRLRTRRWRGKVTVPVLCSESGPIFDSLNIAVRADELGDESPLFPAEFQKEIFTWNERSEEALNAIRALVSIRTLADADARRAALPKMPRGLSDAMSLLVYLGVAFLRKKYQYGTDSESWRADYRQVLTRLREGLADGNYLLGDHFSYADLSMAVTLQAVRPVAHEFLPLRSATRRVWTDDELARDYADLLDWRDYIYEHHR